MASRLSALLTGWIAPKARRAWAHRAQTRAYQLAIPGPGSYRTVSVPLVRVRPTSLPQPALAGVVAQSSTERRRLDAGLKIGDPLALTRGLAMD